MCKQRGGEAAQGQDPDRGERLAKSWGNTDRRLESGDGHVQGWKRELRGEETAEPASLAQRPGGAADSWWPDVQRDVHGKAWRDRGPLGPTTLGG